ncbi:MAG: IS21 family transposase [Planctomycetota bacterium]|jgi:transposase
MRKLREILRLKLERQLAHRAIAESLGISAGTVGTTLSRASKKGLATWEAVCALDDVALEELLYGKRPGPGTSRPLPDPVHIHTERQKRGVTLELLHLEYLAEHPDGYRYTAFCDHYRRWLKKRRLSMRQLHRAGEKLFIDYSGDTAEVVDPHTGEVRAVEVFVAVLGASNYTYVEATWTQQLPDWTASHVRAVQFFGGVTEVWVPDQLRSAVSKPHLYDPDVNSTYADLARHFDVVVIPARPRKPKDKAKVETGVQLAQRWILARLRNETFFSLAALNQRIRELNDELNRRPMRGYGGQCRRERFEALDRPALKPPPTDAYVYSDWKKVTVNIDYHVDVERHLYSVPYQLVGERLEARYSEKTVELLYRGRRVAAHRRSHRVGGFTTNSEHMPKAHRQHAEWSPSRLIRWAAKFGPATEQLVTRILEERPHPEQGYRACLGILRMGKRYGDARVEAAAHRALLTGIRRVRQFEAILKNGLDRMGTAGLVPSQGAPTIAHDNVRGPNYYG